MIENKADIILNKILDRVEAVSQSYAQQFRGMKPFNKTQIPNDKVLQIYEDLGTLHQQGSPIPANLFSKYDSNTLNRFIYDMEQLKARRGGK